ATVPEADEDRVVQAARPGPAAHAATTDVRLAVVGPPSAVERALKEAALHPAGAAVAGDVLALLEVLHASVLFQLLQGIRLVGDVLPAHVDGLVLPIALERLDDDDGVAEAVGERRRDARLRVLVEHAVVV